MTLSPQNWQEVAQALDRDLTRVKGLLEEAIQQIEYECGERDAPPGVSGHVSRGLSLDGP